MAASLDNALSVVKKWWVTPAPAPFPPPAPPYDHNYLVIEDDDPALIGGGGSLDDLPDTESTVLAAERVNRPILEHGVDTGNFDVLLVPVTQVGFVGVFDVNGDGISLVSRALDQSGNVIESSPTARLFIRVNSEGALGMPFSFLLDQFGSQKCDLLSLAARVQRIWVYCAIASQDPVNNPYVVLVFTKGISISGLFGSAGIASVQPSLPGGGAGGNLAGVVGGGVVTGGGGGVTGGGGGKVSLL